VQNYKLTLPTSAGNITIPQLGGSLTLTGRDSKIHVVDYVAGSTELLYSTGEIATWATIDNRDVIVLYGNEGETHETAFKLGGKSFDIKIVSGTGKVTSKIIGGSLVINYSTDGFTVVKMGDNILAYILRELDMYDVSSMFLMRTRRSIRCVRVLVSQRARCQRREIRELQHQESRPHQRRLSNPLRGHQVRYSSNLWRFELDHIFGDCCSGGYKEGCLQRPQPIRQANSIRHSSCAQECKDSSRHIA
jgi:hypothetical protein